MTDEMMNLRTKTPDADVLREMIGFAAQRMMELEVEGLIGASYGEKRRSATATATGSGRPAPAWSSCSSPSCARVPISRLPAAARHGREGAHRRGAGGRRAGRLDPLGGRSGAGEVKAASDAMKRTATPCSCSICNGALTKATVMIMVICDAADDGPPDARFIMVDRRSNRGISVLSRDLAVSLSEMAFRRIIRSTTRLRRAIRSAMKAANAASRKAGAIA
jgi:hypothetical protein